MLSITVSVILSYVIRLTPAKQLSISEIMGDFTFWISLKFGLSLKTNAKSEVSFGLSELLKLTLHATAWKSTSSFCSVQMKYVKFMRYSIIVHTYAFTLVTIKHCNE